MFSKPQFLVIGPYRTGTTWLYSQLCNIEGIKMPPYKELNFFFDADMNMQFAEYKKSGASRPDLSGLEITGQMMDETIANLRRRHEERYRLTREKAGYLWAQYYYHLPRNFSWLAMYLYSRLFKHSATEISGDVSPAYFTLSPAAIKLISHSFPETKVIIIIRDPVEREWSNIRTHYLKGGDGSSFPIREYLQKPNLQRDYKLGIGNWEEHWNKQHICYMFYDELKADKEQFIAKIIQFIQPPAKVKRWVTEKVGESPKGNDGKAPAKLTPEIKSLLIEKNLPQYHFLAEKFGAGSYPARWLENLKSQNP